MVGQNCSVGFAVEINRQKLNPELDVFGSLAKSHLQYINRHLLALLIGEEYLSKVKIR